MSKEKKKLLIGSPNVKFINSFKNEINKMDDYMVADTSISEADLIEYLELHPKEIYGLLITSDLAKKLKDKRLDYLADLLFTIREKYSDLRIVILSYEKVGHPFLAELVNMGIYNVFMFEEDSNVLTVDSLIGYLENGRPFSEISRLREFDSLIPWRRISNGPQSITIENKSTKEDKEGGKDSTAPITKTRIKERIVEVEKEKIVIESKYINLHNSTIGILNLSPGAGSTFLSVLLAQACSARNLTCALLEYPYSPKGTPSLYDQLFLAHKCSKKPFYNVPRVIKNVGFVDKKNVYHMDDVAVLAAGKEDWKEWTYENHLHYIHSYKSSVTIMDLGSEKNNKIHDENIEKILMQLDHCFVVIDPLPHEFLANKQRFIELVNLKQTNENIHFIFNKWNKEATKLFTNELPINYKESLKAPYIERDILYKGYADLKQPYEIKEVKEKMDTFVDGFMKIVVPELKPSRMRNRLFNRKAKHKG